eukprot:m.123708 g.123708  ORF g.123708 m.123708 type:complete len:635 (+) comp16599_c1_seq3:41-1945(+)
MAQRRRVVNRVYRLVVIAVVVLMQAAACSSAQHGNVNGPALRPWDQAQAQQQRQRRKNPNVVTDRHLKLLKPLHHLLNKTAGTGAQLKPCPKAPPTLPFPPGPLPSNLTAGLEAVRAVLEHLFDNSEATGGSVSIVYKERVLLSYHYGSTRRQKGHGQPDASGTGPLDNDAVNADTLFRLGSITKVFTDLLMIRGVENGTMSADDSIKKYLGTYKPAWPPARGTDATPTPRGATLRDLGSHRAGLPRYSPCTFADCNITLPEAIRRINEWTLLSEPGTQVSYSNIGFSVLGEIMGRFGSNWQDEIGVLAGLLGMNRTSALNPSNVSDNVALGYDADGKQVLLQDLGFESPAGAIWSSATDMNKLMSFLLRDGAGRRDELGGGQPLDAATVRAWLSTRLDTNPTNIAAPSVILSEWGMPFEYFDVSLDSAGRFPRFFLATKDGSVPGYNAQLQVQRDLGLGMFAAMSTGADGRNVPFFSDTVVTFALGVVPLFIQALEALAADSSPTRLLPPAPERFVGTFVDNATHAVIHVGWNSSGAYGNSSLYILQDNIDLAEPSTALEWLPQEDGAGPMVADAARQASNVVKLRMLPFPTDACDNIQDGNNYVLTFALDQSTGDVLLTVEGYILLTNLRKL